MRPYHTALTLHQPASDRLRVHRRACNPVALRFVTLLLSYTFVSL